MSGSWKAVCASALLALGCVQARAPACAANQIVTVFDSMRMPGTRLKAFENTANDDACFKLCSTYSSVNKVTGKETICLTSVRRRNNGDCYLYAESQDKSVPTNMGVFLTFCRRFDTPDDECTVKTAARDCKDLISVGDNCKDYDCKPNELGFLKCTDKLASVGSSCYDYYDDTCDDSCDAQGECAGGECGPCDPATSTQKLRMTFSELQYIPNTATDAVCLQFCNNFSAFSTVTGRTVFCNTSVRRKNNGDCYLYEETVNNAVPTNMGLYASYCKKGSGADPVACKVTTETRKLRIPGERLGESTGTVSDAACYQRCADYSSFDKVTGIETVCTASVRRRNNGDCYLYDKTRADAVPTGMGVYLTTCI